MALFVLLAIVFTGAFSAFYSGDIGEFFAGLLLAVVLSLAVATVAELADDVDRTAARPVETVECIDTDGGIVVLADGQLFNDYELVSNGNRIVTEYQDQDNWLSWPWLFMHGEHERLEFDGC